jgi:hypothetical protein
MMRSRGDGTKGHEDRGDVEQGKVMGSLKRFPLLMKEGVRGWLDLRFSFEFPFD